MTRSSACAPQQGSHREWFNTRWSGRPCAPSWKPVWACPWPRRASDASASKASPSAGLNPTPPGHESPSPGVRMTVIRWSPACWRPSAKGRPAVRPAARRADDLNTVDASLVRPARSGPAPATADTPVCARCAHLGEPAWARCSAIRAKPVVRLLVWLLMVFPGLPSRAMVRKAIGDAVRCWKGRAPTIRGLGRSRPGDGSG